MAKQPSITQRVILWEKIIWYKLEKFDQHLLGVSGQIFSMQTTSKIHPILWGFKTPLLRSKMLGFLQGSWLGDSEPRSAYGSLVGSSFKINLALWYLNTWTSSKFPRISFSFRASAACYLNIPVQAVLSPFGVIISSTGENRSPSLKLQQVQHSRRSYMEVCRLLIVKCCRTTKLKAKNLIIQIQFSCFPATVIFTMARQRF